MIFILLTVFSLLYIISSTKVINSGDAGEFIVSATTLGIAHPSGYPLYLEILKLFSFIPIGNIGFRMVLVSVLFSALSIYIVHKMILKTTNDKWSALFTVVLLGVAYSFWGQSVVIKFYPLNLFLILLISYFAIKTIVDGYDRRYQFLICFILGLTLANHHTGFMMVVPLLVLSLFYLRNILKNLPLSIPFFLAGFVVNIHMLIRGERGFSVNIVNDLNSFLNVVLRKSYEKGASTELVQNIVRGIDSYFYAIKNTSIILINNFPPYVFPLFFIGVWMAFRFSKKLGLFILTFFLTYSFLLAKLVFSDPVMKMDSWYMGAHQYFLPMLACFTIFCGFGFFYLLGLIRKTKMELVKFVFPIAMIIIVGLSSFERLIDQNFNDNYIPQTATKTILTSLPVGSIYLTFGDNHTFQAWYFKYIAKYRDDICNLDYFAPDSTVFLARGCKPERIHRDSYFFSAYFTGDSGKISYARRMYSIIALVDENPLRQFLKNQYWVFSYMLLPINLNLPESYIEKKLTHWQELKQFTMLDCASYKTDDQFTRLLCNYSLPFLAYLAKSIEVKNPSKTIEYDAKRGDETFLIKVGMENREILDLYGRVLENNRSERFRYYIYTKEYLEKKK